jgi:hypothetical protein
MIEQDHYLLLGYDFFIIAYPNEMLGYAISSHSSWRDSNIICLEWSRRANLLYATSPKNSMFLRPNIISVVDNNATFALWDSFTHHIITNFNSNFNLKKHAKIQTAQ